MYAQSLIILLQNMSKASINSRRTSQKGRNLRDYSNLCRFIAFQKVYKTKVQYLNSVYLATRLARV